ncbi:hypothetical protein [Marivirga lumbricoides]|uniref:hypothetical protein n=1 Tax=Marivirga lumbricoides TaxID=1046115 RepID=UPI0031F12D0A
MKAYYDGKVTILDPMEETLKMNFSDLPNELHGKSTDLFLTTGDAALMARLANRLYGLVELNIESISI